MTELTGEERRTDRFDLQLDRLTKMSTVSLGVLGLLATTYVTVWVIIPAHDRDGRKVCSDYKLGAQSAAKEAPDDDHSAHVELITEFCPRETRESAFAYVNSEAADEQILQGKARETQRALGETAIFDGFVSLGKASDEKASNFRAAASGAKAVGVVDELGPGSVLEARWPVNLRSNDSNTQAGTNPPILTIQEGSCVRLAQRPRLLRGSYWARASLSQCE